MTKPLVISNIDLDADEMMFSNEHGAWNVSRALRDCKAGKHKAYVIDVAEAYANNSNIEVDEAKVERLVSTRAFNDPLLAIIEDGKLWLIDGHHRLRAMHRLGIKDAVCVIIEEVDAKPYIIWFNGERKPPFALH